MELAEKLAMLASAAKYDASCASSGGGTSTGGYNASGGTGGIITPKRSTLGTIVPAGVCHSWTQDGRCISLLKLLFSNVCRYDCAYCVNRVSADIPRTSFTIDELVKITVEFYRRNYIEGLFLSSGIFADPDTVMKYLIETARKLRQEAGFGGYIHLKAIPGAGIKALKEAGLWADRLSANIELPTQESLSVLAPQKSGKEILGTMATFANLSAEREEDASRLKTVPPFAPAGQSTQLVIGASPEDDRQILTLSSSLYRNYKLRRVYYSAYVPINSTTSSPAGLVLPQLVAPPLLREHRLYQADWLLRFYKFSTDELVDTARPFLDTDMDPKTSWALNHLGNFPIEAATAEYERLLRVPGIGIRSARRIVELRRSRKLSFELLRNIGVSFKRAKYFLSVSGAFMDRPENPEQLRCLLSDSAQAEKQLPLFEF